MSERQSGGAGGFFPLPSKNTMSPIGTPFYMKRWLKLRHKNPYGA
jgi:hypothetical protein